MSIPVYYSTLPKFEDASIQFRAKSKHPSAPETCPECNWTNVNLMNYGSHEGGNLWLCHVCAARKIQRCVNVPPMPHVETVDAVQENRTAIYRIENLLSKDRLKPKRFISIGVAVLALMEELDTAKTNVRHWRDECGKLDSRARGLQSQANRVEADRQAIQQHQERASEALQGIRKALQSLGVEIKLGSPEDIKEAAVAKLIILNDTLEEAKKQVEELANWKAQQIELESKWDEQAVGNLMVNNGRGEVWGRIIREHIQPFMEHLLKERDDLRKSLDEAIDRLGTATIERNNFKAGFEQNRDRADNLERLIKVSKTPWLADEFKGWSICGMNHYHLGGERMVFVSMVSQKDNHSPRLCIKAEGKEDEVWRMLSRQVRDMEASKHQVKFPPMVWNDMLGTGILDPDGFDRSGLQKPVTLEEFKDGLIRCTVNNLGQFSGRGEPLKLEEWQRAARKAYGFNQ